MATPLTLENAFKLLDEYNNPATSERRMITIVTKLYHAGYKIRPAQQMILHDEVKFEHINAGSNAWTLYTL